MARGLYLRSFRLKNFKSVLDSGTIKFTPLTVFIGDNGSGKSSLIEGLETLQSIALDGLDTAMQRWRGIEHIWHKTALGEAKTKFDKESGVFRLNRTISFDIQAVQETKMQQLFLEVGAENTSLDQIWASGFVGSKKDKFRFSLSNTDLLTKTIQAREIRNWQFLEFSTQSMGLPTPQRRTSGSVRLARNGSNVAEYLLSIRDLDDQAFRGILETLMYVLPYAKDLQPTITSELERSVYLQLTESDYKIPGWLLSSGTLRVLALLCVLRHPNPPPIVFIEELENGLDPRTLNLIVEEIRRVVENGTVQVVITTHSPYLLDLLSLSQIIVVERVNGEPVFTRPDSQKSLDIWLEKFSPGQLYTMGRLRHGQS
jgi:predicted ATPase